MTPRLRWSLAPLLLVAGIAVVHTRDGQSVAPASLSVTESMIPMRDGERLYTQVYAPTAAAAPLPILLLRTPYGAGAPTPARTRPFGGPVVTTEPL